MSVAIVALLSHVTLVIGAVPLGGYLLFYASIATPL